MENDYPYPNDYYVAMEILKALIAFNNFGVTIDPPKPNLGCEYTIYELLEF